MCVATFPMPACRSIETDLLVTVMPVLCWFLFAIEICCRKWTLLCFLFQQTGITVSLSGFQGALVALNGPYQPPWDLCHPTHGTGPHFSLPGATSPYTGNAGRCLPPVPPRPCPAWPWALPSRVHSWADDVPAWPQPLPPSHTCLVFWGVPGCPPACPTPSSWGVWQALAGAFK